MQSQDSSKQEVRTPLPLPWGFGSMAWHGRFWWLNWRDVDGKAHWESSGTTDAAEAQRIMANRALARARRMVETLERIANGQETYQGDRAAGRATAKQRAAGRTGRGTAKAAGRGTRREKATRGEN